MNDELPSRRSLDSLKKEAKRWLAALRANAADARARLERAVPNAPAIPTLRDVQHALAREHGFDGWTALKAAIERAMRRESPGGADAIARYEEMADALLDAYRTGTPEAMERHLSLHLAPPHVAARSAPTSSSTSASDPAGPDDDVEITLDDARHLVAREHGFSNWQDLTGFSRASAGKARLAAKPVRARRTASATERRATVASSRDWDEIIRLLGDASVGRAAAPRDR